MPKVQIDPREVKSLVPMPVAAVRLMALAGDRDTPISDICKVIEFDEALTADLLRLANSVSQGSRVPVDTVNRAVVRLGIAQLIKFVVGRQMAGPMSQACPGYELAEHHLWRHSVASALAAEVLCPQIQPPLPRVAFTASLLHDIGKLLLGRYMELEIQCEIRRLLREEGLSFVEAERRVLDTDHAEVGGSIARYWNFPAELVTAIEMHHRVDEAEQPLVDLVHLSDLAAKQALEKVGSGDPGSWEGGAPSAGRLRLPQKSLDTLCPTVQKRLADAERFFLTDS